MNVAKPRTYRPIHLATLITLTVIALTITAVAAWLMWDAAKVPARLITSPDLAVRAAQLRVDVIRNILAVGAGTGGLIALFLALRRQYVKERVDYDDQAHKNRTADDARHDATERRVTDLYVKAAEQLGSENAAVRLAALYALERLGQGNPEHRQTIVDLFCAYLRMPYEMPDDVLEPDGQSGEEDVKRHHERQVRLTAQRILAKHLRYETVSIDTFPFSVEGGDYFWSDMHVDLTGAALIDFSLAHCAAGMVHAVGADFYGRSDFRALYLAGQANFAKSRFRGFVDFSDSEADFLICSGTIFDSAVLVDRADFDTYTFRHATFRNVVSFRQTNGVGDFELARACLTRGHRWPAGYTVSKLDNEEMGFVVEGHDGGERRSPDPESVSEEAEANSAVPQQPTGRDPVNPQPSPNPDE
ncbi:pentapeptide repeat-containing protein [Micromonospora chalcea]|uniref:pentapeptide repeat-containing protein n=1 Tax=Micromonospora chalcea TaxID=1874 RepID=UPI000F5D61B3|nr:pentapeptide repeat-containing protein [Micromonospora chalcea]